MDITDEDFLLHLLCNARPLGFVVGATDSLYYVNQSVDEDEGVLVRWSAAPEVAGAGRHLTATTEAEWGTGGEEDAALAGDRIVRWGFVFDGL